VHASVDQAARPQAQRASHPPPWPSALALARGCAGGRGLRACVSSMDVPTDHARRVEATSEGGGADLTISAAIWQGCLLATLVLDRRAKPCIFRDDRTYVCGWIVREERTGLRAAKGSRTSEFRALAMFTASQHLAGWSGALCSLTAFGPVEPAALVPFGNADKGFIKGGDNVHSDQVLAPCLLSA
jgi:hypothetical protein